jgi:hypothetical protein
VERPGSQPVPLAVVNTTYPERGPGRLEQFVRLGRPIR